MTITVSTNTGALMAQAAISSANKQMAISIERLSTGKRINSASDDAAGVAIESRLTAQVRGTQQAIRNAMDAQSLLDTAEGAHVEIENALQRMREIAVQASNDTNNYQDRNTLQTEIIQLRSEINRIAETTTWAGIKLLDGTQSAYYIPPSAVAPGLTFQVGANNSVTNASATDSVNIDIDSLKIYWSDHLHMVGSNWLSVGNHSAAFSAINNIDTAITNLNTQRSKIGSLSKRLDHAINNLTNISNNLQAGLGRISDADFAVETTNLAKAQILLQASIAMLAQANASKQNVLTLLQG